MQLRCQNCPYICKRLDQDESEHIIFENISPADVIEFFERALKNYHGLTLETLQYCSSHGYQLAILFNNKKEDQTKPQALGPFLVLFQCAVNEAGKTDLSLRFDVPLDCGALDRQTEELSRIVKGVLSLLRRKDRSSRCS